MFTFNFFLLIVFILFIVKSISINFENRGAFQTLPDNNETIVKRQIIFRKKLTSHGYVLKVYPWRNPIPYYVDKRVDRGIIFNILKNIELETCLIFKPVDRIPRKTPVLIYDFISKCKIKESIFSKRYIDPYCYTNGYTYRETFHMLGLVYEHQRKNRDKYILLNHKAIDCRVRNYFSKFSISPMDEDSIPFDYGSIMLPDAFFLANKRAPTMIPSYFLYKRTMGQDIYPSFIDFKRINKYYCSKNCKKELPCKNGGYTDPQTCNSCKCIFGHTGTFCEYFTNWSPRCHNAVRYSGSAQRTLAGVGLKNCAYMVKSTKGKHIGIKILSGFINSTSGYICSPDSNLEVKYLGDKTTTGARFCGNLKKTYIFSEDEVVYIYFKSKDPKNRFIIQYKSF
uniref:Metalloendopeptidase n=1 Tax=Strongyloides stercoralis TaxID=6248 RepID=A0A913HKF1_STRER